MTPIRPVSDEHRHADYAPRSAVLSILRDAGVDETIVAQVSDVLPAPVELEPNELEVCPNPWCASHERPDRNYSPFIEKGRAAPEVAVSCPVCPMRGPWADTEAEAIAAWNRRAQAPRSCWQPIEQKPDRDMAVLYFFSNLEFRSMDGGPSTMGPIRDHAERCEIGFYFAEHSMWCEAGTGHDVFECWRDKSDFPTHWQPLPEPPATAIRSNSHD